MSGTESFLAEIDARRKNRQRKAAEDLARRRAAFTGACSWCLDGELDDGECDKCARGRRVKADRETFAREREAQQHRDARREILLGAGLPERRWQQTLDSFPRKEIPAYGELLRFLDAWDGRRGLILAGAYGTGKTGLLTGAIREIADRYVGTTHRICFTTSPDLMNLLRDGIDDRTFAEREEHVKWVRLLAIDDLGAERPTEWVVERLFTIINHRYEYDLPTFLTTNCDDAELNKRIGARLVDRLAEVCAIVPVEGPNLRRLGGPR